MTHNADYVGHPRRKTCRHVWDKWLWKQVGPAPDFADQRCVLWRCDSCGKERSLFEGISPNGSLGTP